MKTPVAPLPSLSAPKLAGFAPLLMGPVGLALLFGIYALLACSLPMLDDELYYWCWSKSLQLSYYDHPPMVAYMIALSTSLLGDSMFAIRLPAIVTAIVMVTVLVKLMKCQGLIPYLLFTPLVTFGAVLVTPDTPLLMFWSLYLLWLVKIHTRLQEPQAQVPLWLWVLGGVLLGCGVLGKYTMGLGAISGGVTFLFIKPWRRWAGGYVFHALISCAVASPILFYNIPRDFVPIRYQWGHAMAAGDGTLKFFGEFLGVQLLLFGLLPFALLPYVVKNFKTLMAEPRLRVCTILYALPMLFFIYKSLKGPLEGNWALAAYLGFWPVLATWLKTEKKWLIRLAFAVPAGAVAILALHFVWPIPLLKPEQDRIHRQQVKVDSTFEVAKIIKAHGQPWPVFSPFYQNTAMLRFAGLDARQYEGLTRPSHFTQKPEHLSDLDVAYVVHDWHLPNFLIPEFGPPEVIGTVPLVVRGKLQTQWLVMVYRKLPAPR